MKKILAKLKKVPFFVCPECESKKIGIVVKKHNSYYCEDCDAKFGEPDHKCRFAIGNERLT